jgi:hypothetical protein
MRSVPIIVALTALSGGCAVGQKISYQDATPALVARASMSLAVVVQDQRPEITNVKKGPQFVGLMRGGYGNPFDVETMSGRPLADDVAAVVSRSLAPRGFRVKSYPMAWTNPPAQMLATLAPDGASLVLLIQLLHWKSDTYMTTTLGADVVARVLEMSTGRELGTSRVAGARDLGSSFFDPPGHAQKVLPIALRETLEQLLNAPAIVDALSLAHAPAARAATGVPTPATATGAPSGAGPSPLPGNATGRN